MQQDSTQNSSLDELYVTINYYFYRSMYTHILSLITSTSHKSDILTLYKSYALLLLNKPTDSIQLFEQLSTKRETNLSALWGLISAHKACIIVDNEAVQETEARYEIARNDCKVEKARELDVLGRLWCGDLNGARMAVKNGAGGAVWVELVELGNYYGADDGEKTKMEPEGGKGKRASKHQRARRDSTILKILEKNPKDLEALFINHFFLRHSSSPSTHSSSLDALNQIIVYHPSFLPAYTERIYTLLELSDFNQVLEQCQFVSNLSGGKCIDAVGVKTLVELVKGQARDGRGVMEFAKQAEIHSPAPELICTFISAYTRLSNRNLQILQPCLNIMQKALSQATKAQPKLVSKLKSELGYINMLMENYGKAQEFFYSAMSEGENIHAIEGRIWCYMLNGQLDEAEEQLELFQITINKSAELAYLNSVLQWQKYKNLESRLHNLKSAVEIQIDVISNIKLGPQYYATVNPIFLLDLTRSYTSLLPSSPPAAGQPTASPLLPIVKDLLGIMKTILPESIEVEYFMAECSYLESDFMGAKEWIAKCIERNEGYQKAHILLAKVHLSESHPSECLQALEMCLSYNFNVRNFPIYHILKAKALKMDDSLEEALNSLQMAADIKGVKDFNASATSLVYNPNEILITTDDRVTLFLELADTQSKLKFTHEAAKTIEDAMRLFPGAEKDRMLIANADLALERGEVDSALSILSNVSNNKTYFIESKTKQANIYKNYKKDLKGYTRCFLEIWEKTQSLESCLLLGDAYMNIQEPLQAIKIYETAYESNPDVGILASKIGSALIKTHDYKRAIQYYESALLAANSTNLNDLRYDLAVLYKKLKQWQDAERITMESLQTSLVEDYSTQIYSVKLYVLLYEVFYGARKFDKALSPLLKAREIQIHLVSKDSTNSNTSQRGKAAEICFLIGELYAGELKETDKALAYYNESIQYYSAHKKSLLALANLQSTKSDFSAAQQTCSQMLRMDIPSLTTDATLLMADILIKKNNLTQGLFHYRQLLEKEFITEKDTTSDSKLANSAGGPNAGKYKVLSRFIDTMRRVGKLDEVDSLLTQIEQTGSKLGMGFWYCKGEYLKYLNNQTASLVEFNKCRRDGEWGESALYQMIEIYLNPENELLGGGALTNSENSDSELLSILTADKLLKELPQNPKSLKTQVLEAYALLCTKQKPEIESSINKFSEILIAEKEYVPALLGLSTAHMFLKQTPKARNYLKRISKLPWTLEHASEFEKAWLLLADVYVQGGKFDLALELIKRVLTYNKSSVKAWEYQGFIHEKEGSYVNAAECYEVAFRSEKEQNCSVGFKLAFNFLKAKKYVETIEVCLKVLSQEPDYPKIRKEILEKARSMVRI